MGKHCINNHILKLIFNYNFSLKFLLISVKDLAGKRLKSVTVDPKNYLRTRIASRPVTKHTFLSCLLTAEKSLKCVYKYLFFRGYTQTPTQRGGNGKGERDGREEGGRRVEERSGGGGRKGAQRSYICIRPRATLYCRLWATN